MQSLKKLELIGEITSLADDLERSHISRGKLPFDTEATSTFHWRDAEVNMISDLESQITVLTLGHASQGKEPLTELFSLEDVSY